MDTLKDCQIRAEKCMKESKFAEAFFHWTKAMHLMEVKGQSIPLSLYAQRSKCFINTDQYYYAMEDANKIIDLEPDNVMGYLRRAEVFYTTGNLMQALPEITKCFSLATNKEEKDELLEWQRKCRREASKQKERDEQLPYVGAAVGIVIASVVVVADALAYGSSSVVAHPVIKAAIVIVIAGSCYGVAYMFRYYASKARKGLLEEPVDLFANFDSKNKKGKRAKSD